MNILSSFLALIDPLLDGRAYRNKAPDSPATPYATFFRVTSTEGVTLDDNGGEGNESATRIQVDIYGTSPDDVDAKAAAVKAALKGWPVSNVVLLELDSYEAEVDLHRTMLDIATIHQ